MRTLPIFALALLATTVASAARADDETTCRLGVARLKSQVAKPPAGADLDEMRRTLRRAEREIGEREFDECVEILQAGKSDDDDVETEDMFGFTSGSDILEKGKREISGEGTVFAGKRFGRYRAQKLQGTFAFAPVDGLSIEFGAIGNRVSFRNFPDIDNRSTAGFGGVTAEFKWQLLKRGPTTPFGLTLAIEPNLGFFDEEGERGRSVELETRLSADTALIPDTLFAAVDLSYEAGKTRPRSFLAIAEEVEVEPLEDADDDDRGPALFRRAPVERASKLGISAALSFKLFGGLFIGAEVRHARAYDGLTMQRFAGEATFIGPTLYADLGHGFSISAAWSTQVAGHAQGVPGRFDLENFSRHEAKLKVSYEF